MIGEIVGAAQTIQQTIQNDFLRIFQHDRLVLEPEVLNLLKTRYSLDNIMRHGQQADQPSINVLVLGLAGDPYKPEVIGGRLTSCYLDNFRDSVEGWYDDRGLRANVYHLMNGQVGNVPNFTPRGGANEDYIRAHLHNADSLWVSLRGFDDVGKRYADGAAGFPMFVCEKNVAGAGVPQYSSWIVGWELYHSVVEYSGKTIVCPEGMPERGIPASAFNPYAPPHYLR